MKHYAVRKAELIYMNRAMRRVFKQTLGIYRSCVKYLGSIVLDNWEPISAAPSLKARKSIVEALIHHTKDNPSPRYKDFDRLFYKYPSYYRRAAISAAIGQVSSYLTRLAEYEDEKRRAMAHGRKFRKRPPRLNLETNICPALYRGQMFKAENGKLFIKVFIRNTWDWVEASIPGRDIKSLSRMEGRSRKVCCPALSFAYGKFYLDFPFEPVVREFPETPLPERLVLGVDLGINRGAVCSSCDINGNVYGRSFDPFGRKRAAMGHILELIRRKGSRSGPAALSSLYTKLSGIKEDYARQLSRWIVDTAKAAGVYGIALESLGKMKWRGGKKGRLHHWCKRRIASFVKGMAFREGIRVFIVNPRNTSSLAYNGSGKVSRDKNNFSLCTFADGKRYNCDLNASYNICARYFLREMAKSMPPKAWERLVAEVPEAAKRTSCTLSTLWKINKAGALPAA